MTNDQPFMPLGEAKERHDSEENYLRITRIPPTPSMLPKCILHELSVSLFQLLHIGVLSIYLPDLLTCVVIKRPREGNKVLSYSAALAILGCFIHSDLPKQDEERELELNEGRFVMGI